MLLTHAAVLFDLDDTLYEERTFVESGFREVSRALAPDDASRQVQLQSQMLTLLAQEGRGRIFDRVRATLGNGPSADELVAIYRAHVPVLRLYDDAAACLQRLRARGLRLGVVTDGLASVQRRKLEALGVSRLVDVCVVTDELGRGRSKPDPAGYLSACESLGIAPDRALYVGDDPHKDFLGARRAGLGSVRVIRPTGEHMRVVAQPGFDADETISSLHELATA